MNNEWRTPLDLFGKVDKEFGFTVDLCTNGENSLCDIGVTEVRGYSDSSDCKQYTDEVYWMNPPYSRDLIANCMEEAYKIAALGRTVVCLVRFDPSAKWFQDWVDLKATEVRMLDRRVKFQGAESAYNFPCCLVVYNPHYPSNYDGYVEKTDYYLWGWK